MGKIEIISEAFGYLEDCGFTASKQKSNFGEGVRYTCGKNCIYVSFDIREDAVGVEFNRDDMDPFKWQSFKEAPIGGVKSREAAAEKAASICELAKKQKGVYRGLPEEDFAAVIGVYASYLKEHMNELRSYFEER